MSLSDHESGRTPTCSLCGKPMPPGEEMFKFHGYSGPCPKSTPKEPAPSPVEPAGAADDARHQQEVAISASGNCDDFEATIAELRQDLDEANAVIARYGFGGAKRIEAKLNSEVAWRDDEIKRLKALLKSLETSTPVEPAGASEPPRRFVDPEPECPGPECSRCSGEYCDVHITDPCDCDTAERHANDIGKPVPVSPVAPEPPTEDTAYQHPWHCCPMCGGVHTNLTGAPAPCVWRDILTAPRDGRWVWFGRPVQDKPERFTISPFKWDASYHGWFSGTGWWGSALDTFSHWCEMTAQPPAPPVGGHPLTVER